MACDPATLLTNAACFVCLDEHQLHAIQASLLCEISMPAYLTYVARISSSGINAPVVTVLQNTIGDIVWSRQATGVYRGILAGALPSVRTVAWISHNPVETGAYITAFTVYCSSNIVSIEIFQYDPDGVGTGTDGEMSNASLEIRVYPA